MAQRLLSFCWIRLLGGGGEGGGDGRVRSRGGVEDGGRCCSCGFGLRFTWQPAALLCRKEERMCFMSWRAVVCGMMVVVQLFRQTILLFWLELSGVGNIDFFIFNIPCCCRAFTTDWTRDNLRSLNCLRKEVYYII